MEKSKKPDWNKWMNVPWLTAVEAAALTMDCCPQDLQAALDDFPPPPYNHDLFVLGASLLVGWDAAPELEARLMTLQRRPSDRISPKDLSALARQNNWTVPFEMMSYEETPASTFEADTLLKHIGLLALALTKSDPGKFKRGTKLNVSEIINEIERRVDLRSFETKGLGRSTLSDSIAKGIKILNKE